MDKYIQHQEELLADREMLAQMLGAMPVAFVLQSPDGHMIYVSKEFERLLGYTIDDVQTVDDWMLQAYPDEQYRSYVKNTWQEIADQILNKNAKPKPKEMLVTCKDGSRKYLELNPVLLGGNFLVSMVDITERKLQEDRLRDSETHYKTLAESAFEGIVISHEGAITDTNDQYAALLDCTRTELIGTRIIDCVAPECHEAVIHAIKTDKREPYECILTRKNGECVEVLVRGKSVLIGNIPCRVSVIHDLTEQKRVEREIISANTSFKTLIDSSPLAITVFDLDKNVTLWNSAAEYIYGWTADEVIGHPAPYIPEDKKVEYDVIWQQLLSEPIFGNIDSFRIRKDGTRIDVSVYAVQLKDGQGNTTGIISMSTDISKRLVEEEALRFTQSVVDNMQDTAIWIAPDAHMVYANKAATDLLGYTNKDLLNLTVSDVNPNFPAGTWLQHLDELRKQHTMIFESSLLTKNGRTIPVEIRANIVTFEDIEYNCAIIRDITERKKAEESLLHSEQKFRGLIENGVDMISVISPQGVFQYASPEILRKSGYDIDSVIGHMASEFIHPDDIQQAREAFKLCIDKPGVPISMTYRIVRKDGDCIVLEGQTTNMLDVPGVNGMVGNYRDVTERKKAEKDLEESETRYKTLANAVSESVSITHNGIFVDVNDQYLALTGYTREELIGTTAINLVAPESREMITKRAIENRTDPCECLLINSRGGRVEVEVHGKTLKKGDTEYRISIIRDLTEQKRVERELRSANEELRIINRLIAETTALAEPESILELAIDEALRIAGLEGGTICLVRPDDVLELATHRATSQETIDDIKTGNIRVGECLCGMCAQTGKPLILSCREDIIEFATREVQRQENITFHAAFPLMVESRSIGVLCVFTRTDKRPTERSLRLLETMTRQVALAIDRARLFAEVKSNAEKLEQRVMDRTIQLEDVNKELEAFSYTVSHDLRTPLRAINGFTEAMLQDYKDTLDETALNYLNRTKAASIRMGQLIDDILRLSRINRAEVSWNRMDLSKVVESIAANLTESQPERCVEFIIEPDVIVNADINLIRIALENLIGNAWKFTSNNDSAHIEFGVIRNTDKQTYFIKDNGAGFNQAYADKLFAVFQRLVTEAEFPGTGIGLATVKRIIQKHNGSIWAESEVGEGAVFYFTVGGGSA